VSTAVAHAPHLQDWPSRRLSLGRNYFVLVFLRLIERPNRAAFFRMVAGERLKRTAMASKVREGPALSARGRSSLTSGQLSIYEPFWSSLLFCQAPSESSRNLGMLRPPSCSCGDFRSRGVSPPEP